MILWSRTEFSIIWKRAEFRSAACDNGRAKQPPGIRNMATVGLSGCSWFSETTFAQNDRDCFPTSRHRARDRRHSRDAARRVPSDNDARLERS